MKNKKTIILILLSIVAATAVFYFVFNRSATAPDQANNNAETSQKNDPQMIRLIANGDLLPHDSVNQQAKTSSGYDYKQFFSEIQSIYENADISFCNQEVPSGGEELGISGYPTFNAPSEFAKDISAVGCNVINLANNHMNDKGSIGIKNTRNVWDNLKPLAVAGANRNKAEQDKIVYFESKGVKFGFVAFTEYSNNRNFSPYEINILDEDIVKRQIKQASENSDIVIVSAHWGTEYSSQLNSQQEKWAKLFSESGADLVFGTGPHVLQPVKKINSGSKETLVFFSLGNLLSTQLEIDSLIGGFAVIDINPETKKVIQTGFLPTYMHYEWTPDQKAQEDLLSRKNLKIYPLSNSAEPLKRSLHSTNVEKQTDRIEDLLNQYTKIKIYNSVPN